MNRDQTIFTPVATVADEELIRFVIYTGPDEYDRPEFDDFSVDRRAAAGILRKHHADGAFIEPSSMKAGFEVTLTRSDGVVFRCAYPREQLNEAIEAARNLMLRQTRHYTLQIEPSDPPPPSMTLAQWVAQGRTLD